MLNFDENNVDKIILFPWFSCIGSFHNQWTVTPLYNEDKKLVLLMCTIASNMKSLDSWKFLLYFSIFYIHLHISFTGVFAKMDKSIDTCSSSCAAIFMPFHFCPDQGSWIFWRVPFSNLDPIDCCNIRRTITCYPVWTT